ncbi:MAG: cytochrome c biogenesis protein CcdA, partial [Bacillota bacterium]
MALKGHYAGEVEIIVADLEQPETKPLLEEFAVHYIPAFFFIDEGGVVLFDEAGAFSFEEMTERIDPLVSESAENETLSGLDHFFSVTLPGVMGQRSALALALVFIGGVVTSISPCILSMVPLLVSYIGGYSGDGPRSRGFMLSSSFIIGLAITFGLLGFVAASFG